MDANELHYIGCDYSLYNRNMLQQGQRDIERDVLRKVEDRGRDVQRDVLRKVDEIEREVDIYGEMYCVGRGHRERQRYIDVVRDVL